MIALFALMACASAQLLASHGALLTTGPVAAAGILPSSRFTRSDWVQPGLRYNVPAVAQYNTLTPGYTTLHQTSVPVVARAPLLATTGLIGAHYTAGLAAPLAALPYIR